MERYPTEEIKVDVLTKVYAKVRHEKITMAIALRDTNYSQSGSVRDWLLVVYKSN